jgi:hypothetical protein
VLAELNFGHLTEAEIESSATLFSTEVMPALRSGPHKQEDVYSAAESALVADRLEALGYIE